MEVQPFSLSLEIKVPHLCCTPNILLLQLKGGVRSYL